jgi:hypothetical protein
MPAIVSNADLESCLREILERQEYALTRRRPHGATGVDIVATKGGESWHIECIGYKSSGPARAKDFYESFFRIVSRLNDGAKHCIVALSNRAEVGLPARARQHAVAWERIAKAFPELEIWLVDIDRKAYARTTWLDWLD